MDFSNPPAFLVALQRIAVRAVVNDFLVSTVFGPNPNDSKPNATEFNGHLKDSVALVGVFEKLVREGTIKPMSDANSDEPTAATAEGGDYENTENAAQKKLLQVSADIANYAVLSAALPPLVVASAAAVSPLPMFGGNNINNVGYDAASPSPAQTAPPPPLFDDASIVDAAKFLFHCAAQFYEFFNEEAPPLSQDIFVRVFRAAHKTVHQPPPPTNAANASSSPAAATIVVVPAFASHLSAYLKAAQIQLQQATNNAKGAEDPDVEIPFYNLAPIVDLILRHFPSDLFIGGCCVPIGDASIERCGDEDLLRIIGGTRRRRAAQRQKKGGAANGKGFGGGNEEDNDDPNQFSGMGGPLIAAADRAKTAREMYAEEQARKAGFTVNGDGEDEDDALMGPLAKTRRQATYDEAKTEAYEIEVNDNIPTFLKDVARKTYINYRRAPVNLAEKREQEAQMAARKAVSAAAMAAAATSSSAAAGGASSSAAVGAAVPRHGPNTLQALAEGQEKRNMDRRRLRAIERKRQEAEALAAQQQQQQQGFNTPHSGGGGLLPLPSNIDDDGENNNNPNEANPAALPPRPLTDGELGTNDLEAAGGVRSEKDINSLPPWLRASASGADGKVHFGYQTSKSIEEQRKSLPVYESRDSIVEYVRTHSVTILQGETGSGKTTQIPQYLCDAGLTKRDPSDPYFTNPQNFNNSSVGGGMRQREELMIAITQPRRVAAIELAKRVAKERGTRCGDEVGYTVRFDDQTSDRTKIKYMTDGMLLREALLDDQFTRYSVIILDEAHERSINTDVLFGVLKKAIAKRPSLKLVITSATIELDRFCHYFGASDRFEIKGRTFPVDINYLDTPCSDYVDAAVDRALRIHLGDKNLTGDVLIFLTGEDEINAAMDRIQSRFSELRERAKRELPPERQPYDLLVLPCYATVPNEAMSKVFDKTPARTRKIVISTNVAETSITIDGLAFVIDSGFCKQHVYDPRNKVEELKIVPVSQAQATQRTGRAGRTNAGTCFRLFTQDQFENEMAPATVPEIQRTNLINIVLTLKAVGFDDLLEFDFLDPPPKETLVNALQTLRYLGALDDDGLLTPIGERMSSLPLPPAESKTLLASIDFNCCPTVMTIVSMMGQRKVFFTPADKREEADFAHRQLKHPDGDQLTLANVYNSWVESGMSEKWCKSNFVNPRAVAEARRSRDQLHQMLSQRHDITKDVRDSVAIRKALTSGYFFQVAKRGENNMYVTMADRRAVAMHPTSSLFEQMPQYVVYHQLALKRKEYMMEVMRIEPQWLVELAPAYYSKPKAGELTREQKALRVDPILRPWDSKNSWRISKVRKQKQ